ncbi:DUF2085 domain-containing protein [Chloroflexus sp.]|uniref:DUF2085 domain-containing protein n=1 Tax=Chloroflexus sp. TaxID=1904827 RepID=UPI002601FE64|nr:DUF2085 domain-containing protein [uncultured Chloroflexus sp.]
MNQPSPEEILELARQRIAARRIAAGQPTRAERVWGLAFLFLLATLILIFVLWPGADLEWKLYAAVHGLVAQKHLIFLGEQPLPLCARNLGIYSSFLISLLYLWLRGHSRAASLPPLSLLVTLGAGVLTMLVDGVNSVLEDTGQTYFYLPRNDVRTITGALFGIAITPLILWVFNHTLRSNPEPERPVLDWSDFGGLLVLNGLFILLAHSGLALLYWPLALFGVAGIMSEIFTIFTMVMAALLGYRRRVFSLKQLGLPACLALAPTILFAGGLALFRFASESW